MGARLDLDSRRVALIPVLLLLFPDGRPPSRRWWLGGGRAAAAAAAAGAAAFLGALASLGVRYRRAGALERRQLAWIAYAGALIARGFAAATCSTASALRDLSSDFNVAPLAALPLAIGVAVARHRLYELERSLGHRARGVRRALAPRRCSAAAGRRLPPRSSPPSPSRCPAPAHDESSTARAGRVSSGRSAGSPSSRR